MDTADDQREAISLFFPLMSSDVQWWESEHQRVQRSDMSAN